MIVLTGNEKNGAAVLARLNKYPEFYQEIRLDLLTDELAVENIKNYFDPQKVILTVKEPNEKFAAAASEVGAGYIDIPLENAGIWAARLKGGGQIIVSAHEYEYAPQKWSNLWKELENSPGDILKLAVLVQDAAELSRLKELTAAAGRPFILIAMGEAGKISRLIYRKMGSLWTYICPEASLATAPGQISLEEAALFGLVSAHDWHEISAANENFFALFGGAQICHSPGFAYYNQQMIDSEKIAYFPVITNNLPVALPLFRALGLTGASVTMPNKSAAFTLAGGRSLAAEKSRAVNTLVYRRGGELFGDNSDYLAMRELIAPLKGKVHTAAILGAGGAARALYFALLDAGVSVTVYSRKKPDFTANWQPWGRETAGADMLINATPLGYNGEMLPIKSANLPEIVLDLVMAGAETPLITTARQMGKKAITGYDFWQKQAELQLEVFKACAAACNSRRYRHP